MAKPQPTTHATAPLAPGVVGGIVTDGASAVAPGAKKPRYSSGRLLLLSPWTYQYRHNCEDITVAQCKTMNHMS